MSDTTTSHTPGPWEIDDTGMIYGQAPDENAIQAPIVCKVIGSGNEWDPVTDANARLIAAAPKMREALQILRKDMLMLQSGEWIPEDDSIQASLDVIEAALGDERGQV